MFIGVIGMVLFVLKVEVGLDVVFVVLLVSWEDVINMIGMIDIFLKVVMMIVIVDGWMVKLVGFIKGSGMIVFDMVMMLGFIFIDVLVELVFL